MTLNTWWDVKTSWPTLFVSIYCHLLLDRFSLLLLFSYWLDMSKHISWKFVGLLLLSFGLSTESIKHYLAIHLILLYDKVTKLTTAAFCWLLYCLRGKTQAHSAVNAFALNRQQQQFNITWKSNLPVFIFLTLESSGKRSTLVKVNTSCVRNTVKPVLSRPHVKRTPAHVPKFLLTFTVK